MSTEYYILSVNHLQKVCYILLGDVTVFKALAISDEIHSYFEKNNINIFSELFSVSFNVYQEWLQILISQDLIEMNSLYGPVLNDIRLSSIKHHISSIRYGLEIEPNATIRTYNCDTPEKIFNEWFNDVSSSDKRKEKGMSDNTVSPILSVIEERIKQLKQLECDMDTIKSDIQKHRDVIGELSFKHNELNEDICHINDRINLLLKQARIEEGFTEEYLSRFLKEHGFKKQ